MLVGSGTLGHCIFVILSDEIPLVQHDGQGGKGRRCIARRAVLKYVLLNNAFHATPFLLTFA